MLLYDLHHFYEKKSFKRDLRRAAAMQNVYSYSSEEQNYQRCNCKRWASKRSKLLGKPHPPSIFGVLVWGLDFQRVYVLKHLVKKSEKIWDLSLEFCAPPERNPQQQFTRFRRNGETCVILILLRVRFTNVRFPVGKVTFIGASSDSASWPLHQ